MSAPSHIVNEEAIHRSSLMDLTTWKAEDEGEEGMEVDSYCWTDDDFSWLTDPASLTMLTPYILDDVGDAGTAQETEDSTHEYDAMQDYFTHHEHYLYSCDGNGAYMVTSLWLNHDHHTSMATLLVLRCHDNVRESLLLPVPVGDSGTWFQTFLDDRRKECGLDYRRVSYETCVALVGECRQRMKDRKQDLPDAEAEAVVQLYSLKTTKTDLTQGPTRDLVLPEPSPAPSTADVWLVLQRPEYHAWYPSDDWCQHFECDTTRHGITEELFHRGMRYLVTYSRGRLAAMLRHMALYHATGGETRIASWLLWERAALMTTTTAQNTPEGIIRMAMESSVYLQLMVNKFFDTGLVATRSSRRGQFPHHGEWGKGVSSYILHRDDLLQRGTLPPHVILKTNATTTRDTRHDPNQQQQFAEDRTKRHGACAICGSTVSKDSGESLLSCSQCLSVAYCSRVHQKMHWKRGGHKDECVCSVLLYQEQ